MSVSVKAECQNGENYSHSITILKADVLGYYVDIS